MTEAAIRIEPCTKRIRAYRNGELVLDTRAARYVWEIPYYPAYYIPTGDVLLPLKPTGLVTASRRGSGERLDVVGTHDTAASAAVRYADSPSPELRALVRFDWAAMDQWFEEDEPVYIHPRDPYTRVEILGSSRQVRIEIDGVTVAESGQPRILFESHLPPRYYLPLTDVRTEYLTPSTSQTQCPYKGTAEYWSVTVNGTTYPDLVWTYRTPLPESQKITGLVCFYSEKVDVYLDDELQPRPRTKFS